MDSGKSGPAKVKLNSLTAKIRAHECVHGSTSNHIHTQRGLEQTCTFVSTYARA